MCALDINTKPKTKYACELWQRDEQIRLAIQRVKGRVAPNYELRDEPCAVVGYGPSLRDTWEQIQNYPVIFTCSGSHKFLIERGIIPTYDLNVDPRAHKVGLMGPPHHDVTYLVASTCHPKLFDHLEGYRVLLWHIFDNSEEAIRTLPQGEWALCGGIDAGIRTLTMARFLGFRDLHVFGIDGSSNLPQQRHAGEHPHGRMTLEEVDYDGQTFLTTAGMLAAAQGIWHELDLMPDVTVHFYGDGLIQAMAKRYERKDGKKKDPVIAFRKPELISPAYRELNRQLFASNVAYGVGGGKHAPVVMKLVEALKPSCEPFPTVTDYGAGRCYLAKALPFPIQNYDPCVPGIDESPKPTDIVVCTDCAEHWEEDRVPMILADLHRCTRKILYIVIHTGPSSKVLSDGRNAHILQRNRQWWSQKLSKLFVIGSCKEVGPLLYIVAAPKVSKKRNP
jgi:hypothetical protein